jgi:hypothetical protein
MKETALSRSRRRDSHDTYAPYPVKPALRSSTLRKIDNSLWSDADDLRGVGWGAVILVAVLLSIAVLRFVLTA